MDKAEFEVKVEIFPVKTKLIKLSIFPCGITLLRDTIPFRLWRGDCGQVTTGFGRIYANSVLAPDYPPTALPLEIFEISYDYVKEI